MDLRIIESGTKKVAEVVSEAIELRTVQDALDLMANADYQGARSLILHSRNLVPEFFDLRTKLAGEILQKCANYGVKIAIVGNFEMLDSNALNAFIAECNRGSSIFFVPDVESAIEKLVRS